MADINLQMTESEQITIKMVEGTPINVTISGGISSFLDSIFDPPEDGKRIVRLYVSGNKLKVEYEGGE